MRPDRTRGISAAPGTPSVPLKFGRLKALLAAGQRKWLPRACCCWPAFLGVSGAYPGRWLPTAPGIRARWHGRLFGISGPGGVALGSDIFLRTRRGANCFPRAAKSALLMAASGNKAYKASGSSSQRKHSGEKGLNGIEDGWVKSPTQRAAVDKGRYRAV